MLVDERAGSGLSAGQRLVLVLIIGVVAGSGLAFVLHWPLAVLSGWDVAAVVFLAIVWGRVRRLSPAEANSHATREDSSRGAAELVLLVACVTCLIGVGYALIAAAKENGASMSLLTALAVASVIVSWLVVHTVFALRYARLYYTGRSGGIDFNDDEPPDYIDFAYLAFTVGMTYQVSDTDLKTKAIRREVLRQALLSYMFGTVIIAVTINAVAGFIK